MMNKKSTLVFVDDEPKAGELFKRFARESEFDVVAFDDSKLAQDYLRKNPYDLLITDLSMPDVTGMELLTTVRESGDKPVIIITGFSSVDNAIEALRLGATDFIKKPYDTEELLLIAERTLENQRIRQENRFLKRQLKDEKSRFQMIGRSTAMKNVYSTIDKIADIRCNVIIEGESGTGKELVARALHEHSNQSDKPFVVIDCGAMSDSLLESELFGHEKGAFTGAATTKQGLLETATGGVVFLDEICNISDNMQVKLMRVIQEQQIMRVGGVTPIPIDVRVVVATNRNLDKMVEEGEFRHDLYHRLNVVKIKLPPLRDRRDDIPLLIKNFVDDTAKRFMREVEGFDKESMQRLVAYHWPGNIRELRNLIERHIALADSPLLTLHDELVEAVKDTDAIDADLPALAVLERRYIFKLLDLFNESREKTASTLGVNKSTLWRKLQSYQKDKL